MGVQGKTVLVSESDPGIREFIQAALESALGVRVVAARGGEEAVQLARSVHPDLSLVEVWARPPRGVDVVRQLRLDPATRGIPVLALTYSDEGRSAALEAGCDDAIGMPFQLEDLLEKVQRYLAKPAVPVGA